MCFNTDDTLDTHVCYVYSGPNGGMPMQMVRVSVHWPKPIKAKIDAMKERGTSASWFIRKLVEKHFEQERRNPAA